MAKATVGEIVKTARSELASLTGLDLSSTLAVNREEDGWRVSIELVEKHSLPNGMDVLATYEVKLDEEANVIGFDRTGLRKRVDAHMAGAAGT